MDFLPPVLYINLANRVDRKQNIETQFNWWPPEKIHRIDAIKEIDGALGCGKSHLKALQYAKTINKEYVMIIEDDFQWTMDKDMVRQKLRQSLQDTEIEWNMITLSVSFEKSVPTSKDFIRKLETHKHCNQTTTGYIIKKTYIDTLYNHWLHTVKQREWLHENKFKKILVSRPTRNRIYNKIIFNNYYVKPNLAILQKKTCIDQSWKTLQNDKWYIISPQLAKQYPNYSDIEQKFVSNF